MKPSFCAIANQQIGEDLIGTASHYQTYVLIECPMPWAAKVFTSASIPPTLRQYIKAIKSERSIQFLAINRGISAPSQALTLMVYERTVPSKGVLSAHEALVAQPAANESIQGYRGYEYHLDDLTQVADCLEAHWQGSLIGRSITQKDILVCTHGMRDKCCARFGQPFFRDAAHSAKQGTLPNTRIWKVSHIGGHRFAPTAISFPDGRYYGRLTLSALQQIVTHSGPISQLRSVYRGWGLLPAPLQALEQQLMLKHGWSWFDQEVTYRILSDEVTKHQKSNGHQKTFSIENLRELSVEICVDAYREQGKNTYPLTYRAKIIQDPQKTVCAKASCSSAVATPFVKYTVSDCLDKSNSQLAKDSQLAKEIALEKTATL